ncbi:hypothetical protein OJ997_26675 [Solirubrobacter phytolaccae]|uniref:Uncharacterized protein n=1 Tax=Solirubrobacter phytolaccae TaxID=1404360 RepID=A0A9X3SDP8_9ACTN|nr:hypothetical protein [Solirubrobacter phytolaccae]MDA0183920.1 hypothetical protein [Solirubrobacter phytolaccae]
MPHEPRNITFLGRDGETKHYGIGDPDAAHVEALRARARADAPGFTIAHRGVSAALSLVYWWANENELHAQFFVAPLDEPGALEPYVSTGITCVWEMEVLDFERRAWLQDVLIDDDLEAYLERALEPVAV